MQGNTVFEGNTDTIYTYSRHEAIEDGVLIDVTKEAKEAGINFLVAFTSGLWADYITPDKRAEERGQSIQGRLWDTLMVFKFHAKNCKVDTVYFNVYYVMPGGYKRLMPLWAKIHPGDNGEPVITIMKTNED